MTRREEGLTSSENDKRGSYWAIPANVEKTKDKRIENGKYVKMK